VTVQMSLYIVTFIAELLWRHLRSVTGHVPEEVTDHIKFDLLTYCVVEMQLEQ